MRAESRDVHADLARALQDFWEEYAGSRPTRVRVVSGEGAVVVWLEEVLSPAERHMASTREGREMLRELEERILEQAWPQLRQLAEGAEERDSVPAEVHLDIADGSVLGLFRLG